MTAVPFSAYIGEAHLRFGTIRSFSLPITLTHTFGGVVGRLQEFSTSGGGKSRTGERTSSEIRE